MFDFKGSNGFRSSWWGKIGDIVVSVVENSAELPLTTGLPNFCCPTSFWHNNMPKP
jgi:hypothetical protein